MAGKQMDDDLLRIFEDLEQYKRFCKEFGWYFNEADLYNKQSEGYNEFCRFKEGTRIPKNWIRDGKTIWRK